MIGLSIKYKLDIDLKGYPQYKIVLKIKEKMHNQIEECKIIFINIYHYSN